MRSWKDGHGPHQRRRSGFSEELIIRGWRPPLQGLGRSPKISRSASGDGSTDSTWKRDPRAVGEGGRIRGLRFSRTSAAYAITADSTIATVTGGGHGRRSAGPPGGDPGALRESPEGLRHRLRSPTETAGVAALSAGSASSTGRFQHLANTEYDPKHGNFSIISRRVLNHFRAFTRVCDSTAASSWLGFGVRRFRRSTRALRGRNSRPLRSRIPSPTLILAHSDRPLSCRSVSVSRWPSFSLAFGVYVLVRALFTDFS